MELVPLIINPECIPASGRNQLMAHTGKPTLAPTINNRIEQEQCSVSMAGIQQDLQASLVQLVKSFEVQADTLQSLMKDLLPQSEGQESDLISVENGSTSGNTIDVKSHAGGREFNYGWTIIIIIIIIIIKKGYNNNNNNNKERLYGYNEGAMGQLRICRA